MDPSVSVVITTYNQAEYIEATITSALAQTYQNREVIVVDDGSTDDTPKRVERFKDRIVCIRQTNGGVAASRNSGVAAARGDLVAFLDGDDLWEPEKLAVQVAAHQANPSAGLIVVDAAVFSGAATLRRSALPWKKIAPDTVEGASTTRQFYREFVLTNLISTTSQVMIPSAVLAAVGPSDSRLSISSDYDLYLRIAAAYDVTFIRSVLTRWRYLRTSASGPQEQRKAHYDLAGIAALRSHLRRARPEWHGLIRDSCRRATYEAARTAYDRGCDFETDRPWARRYLAALWATNPANPWPLVFCAALLSPRPLRRAGAAVMAISRHGR
jgi:glycosyltransferase involved in cell wall biosynthesis